MTDFTDHTSAGSPSGDTQTSERGIGQGRMDWAVQVRRRTSTVSSSGPATGARTRPEQLLRAIDRCVLPEMVRAKSLSSHPFRQPPCESIVTPDAVRQLATLCTAPDGCGAMSFVNAARDAGAGVDALCLDLLAPTALLLGDDWNEDDCSFMDVTLGVSRLQHILFGLSPLFLDRLHVAPPPGRILLGPVPGEQHALGLQMVGEFFRREGWLVEGGPSASRDALCSAVRGRWFDVVGLSLGSESLVESCCELVSSIRGLSMNPIIKITIGGQLANALPELHSLVGADMTASEGTRAPHAVMHAGSAGASSRALSAAINGDSGCRRKA